MKRKNILQMITLLVLGLGVLFSLVAFDNPYFWQSKQLIEISVMIREADSTSWATARQGMEQAAADLGAELRFLTLSSPDSVTEQKDLLAREVDGGAEGVVLVPAAPQQMEQQVREAAAKAVVVTMESDMTQSGATACISVDNRKMGEALAGRALGRLAAGDDVVLLDSAPGSSGVSARVDGAERLLKAAGCNVYRYTLSAGQDLTALITKAIATQHPAAILAFDTAATEQAARVAENTENPPLLYGTGATNTIIASLDQGSIDTIAAQNEFAAGYLAVEATVKAVQKKPATEIQTLQYYLVDRQNMDDADNQKLLFPVTR